MIGCRRVERDGESRERWIAERVGGSRELQVRKVREKLLGMLWDEFL